MTTISTFINDSLEELRHVRWPTRQQAFRLSGIVLVFIAVSAVAMGLLDALYSEVMSLLLGAL
jgi:preprotein translocase SecE subunit